MEARRPSIISNATIRQRKYSTDRVLRQAELSARLEEGRPIVSPTTAANTTTEQIDEHPHEDAAEKDVRLSVEGIRSLTRADSMISPFEFHPGQRVGSFPFGAPANQTTQPSSAINNNFDNFRFGPVKAWDEPTAAQEEDIERRAAITRRVDTSSLDFTPAQTYLYRNVAQSVSSGPMRRKWPFLGSAKKLPSKVVERSAITGLQMATAMHAALGLRFVAQRSPDWLRRQQLHVLEYKTYKHKAFSCDSNTAFSDTEGLRRHLKEVTAAPPAPDVNGVTVRLIHIRNTVEAFRYLDEAFAISSPEIHYGERGFREWMQEDRDSKRSSNMTIRWRPGFDTNRQVICMAMGIDLGTSDMDTDPSSSKQEKKSPHHENPLYRKRRIAIYLQRAPSAATPNPKVTQFNSRGTAFQPFAKQDNIVICEYSSDAWSEISSTPSLLALSPVAGLHHGQTGSVAVMASAIAHIFWEIVSKWHSQIAAIHQPFAELEELIHGQPADITHSNKVWEWSRNLQNMLRLVGRHLKAIQTFQDDFMLFAELDDVEWLDDVLLEMKHVADTIRGDYIEPLEHLIDLMYKSVTIRDSRLSLELGTSLWRLSWITFIFLPMTFLVGFFGMNVNVFHDDPSIKWYFIALIPLALTIAAFWAVFNRYGLAYKNFEGTGRRPKLS